MTDDDRTLSSGAVQRATDLTYRQINDWDGRGAMPHSRTSAKGWRRYSPRDVFSLIIAAELHRRFGIPVKKLRYVTSIMSQDGVNHLLYAVDLMSMLGVDMWLMTDFESVFVLDSELEFDDLSQYGVMGGVGGESFVMMKLTALVNRVLESLDHEPFEPTDAGRNLSRELRGHANTKSESERRVLQAIRSGSFTKVEVMTRDGLVTTIRTSEKRDPEASLDELLREHPYQTLTVHMADGGIVSVNQQKTTKPQEQL